jgi:RimJ/RimL family protein N-acetyltransferase
MRLRPLEPGDAPVFAAWGDDEEFRLANGWPLRDRDEARQHWDRLIAGPPSGLDRLAVESDGRVVGYVDLHGDADQCRELGIAVGPSRRWGQGLGRRAAALALTYGFSVLGLELIRAATPETNVRARRMLTSAGLTEKGQTGYEEYRGEVVPILEYEVSRPARLAG